MISKRRRPGGLVVLALSLAVAAALAAPASAAPTEVKASRSLNAAIVSKINATRSAHGLRRLKVAAPLSRAARQHAVSMATLGYFSHTSRNGTSSGRRITSFYSVSQGKNWAVGEVLAWATGDVTAGRVLAMWLASSPHHRQLLSKRWRDVGVSAVRSTNAPGVYGGRTVTIVVVDFGSPG